MGAQTDPWKCYCGCPFCRGRAESIPPAQQVGTLAVSSGHQVTWGSSSTSDFQAHQETPACHPVRHHRVNLTQSCWQAPGILCCAQGENESLWPGALLDAPNRLFSEPQEATLVPFGPGVSEQVNFGQVVVAKAQSLCCGVLKQKEFQGARNALSRLGEQQGKKRRDQ